MRRPAVDAPSIRQQLIPLTLALVVGFASAAAAQTPSPTGAPRPQIVRVRVTDSIGAPISGAEISIFQGLQRVAAQGTTGDDGTRMLTIAGPAPDGSYDAIVRRIGFARADRFFTLRSGDTASLFFVLKPTPRTLAPVNVTAQEDAKRKRYFIDADDIANSARPIFDAMDVVNKLRPDMMSNPTPGSMDGCGLQDVWVNGRRITLPPIDPVLAQRAAAKRHVAAYASPAGGPPIAPLGDASVPVSVQSVLSTIHPEHIAEMTFHDCNDFSIDRAHGRNALFVVLKAGVAFEPGVGSYVIDEGPASARSSLAAREFARRDSIDAALSAAPSVLESFRHRLLGLFDEMSGEPLEGVVVVDSASGSWVRTPTNGIVSLAFLPEGPSTLRLQRTGVRDTLFHLTISPRDTTPITLTLGAPR